MGKKPVITIEREYGSGGRKLGERLSAQLGIPYYDDDIIRMSSEQSFVAESYFRMHDEKTEKNARFTTAKNPMDKPSLGGNITKPENLFRFEAETIQNLAAKGPCILIGRCSDFVLRAAGFGEFISLFVYCSLSDKVRRVMKVDGVSLEEALERIQSVNRERRNYYKYYTGEAWGDPGLYDMMINTSHITIPQTAEFVMCYLRLRGYDI